MASESETMREAFEQWAVGIGEIASEPDCFGRCTITGEYHYPKVESRWQAWQAAWSRAPSAEAKADGSIVLSPEGQQLLGRAIGSHGAVVQYLTMGRPDLALAESRQWVEGVSLAADTIRAQDAAIAQQGAAAAQEVGRGEGG